jgi:hypothetical protein
VRGKLSLTCRGPARTFPKVQFELIFFNWWQKLSELGDTRGCLGASSRYSSPPLEAPGIVLSVLNL